VRRALVHAPEALSIMSHETRTHSRLDALRQELDNAATGKWRGWRLVLLWAWMLIGVGLILAYIAVGTTVLETVGVLVLFGPLTVRGPLAFRDRR